MIENATPICDATIAQSQGQAFAVPFAGQECSLVQIYPPNVVEGLVRIQCDRLSIGRDPQNDLPLTDGSVSRYHAELLRSEHGFCVRDLGSTNGTFVNDQRISHCNLEGGEILRIGSFLFKYLTANAIEAQYHATVYDAMTRDGLTGAFNKRYLMESLQREISRSRRCNLPLSVLIMDIDHFKKINDTYGHLVGDETLREFSQRIASTQRCDDLFCRYGGEEFVMILGGTTLEEAVAFAERCRTIVASSPFPCSCGDVPVTVSIGAATFTPDTPSSQASDLLQQADQCLYEAKQSGRNRVCS
ncbi:MAG: GGDEF domain-containing protein [Pirellulales bacterium]